MSQVYMEVKKDDDRVREISYPEGNITFSLKWFSTLSKQKRMHVDVSFRKKIEHASEDQLLDYSIAKWKYLTDAMRETHAVVMDGGTETCALCMKYYEGECEGCPIKEETGLGFCAGTPYNRYSIYKKGQDEFKQAYNGAIDMMNYLIGLRGDKDYIAHVFKFGDWSKGAIVAGAISGESKIECSNCGDMFRFIYNKAINGWSISLSSVDDALDWSIGLTYPFYSGAAVKISIGE